jgi:dTDP-glucose 4,6-dehydratase
MSNEHDPVNIGNPTEMTILEFAEAINRLVSNPSGIHFRPELRLGDDPQRRQPDITRAKQILGWTPTISLDEGLKKTIPYFKEKLGIA